MYIPNMIHYARTNYYREMINSRYLDDSWLCKAEEILSRDKGGKDLDALGGFAQLLYGLQHFHAHASTRRIPDGRGVTTDAKHLSGSESTCMGIPDPDPSIIKQK
jgi:hypothetical protein